MRHTMSMRSMPLIGIRKYEEDGSYADFEAKFTSDATY